MNWKELLTQYEQKKDWEKAIHLIQNVIDESPNDLDAYLDMNYLLMNLLVEEDYDRSKHNYYAGLLKKYFIESYAKFSFNPEYLFYIGKIACMSEWYFDMEIDEAYNIMKESVKIDQDNMLYKWANYSDLDTRDPTNKKNIIRYAKQAVSNLMVQNELNSKGSLGQYLWNALKYWSNEKVC